MLKPIAAVQKKRRKRTVWRQGDDAVPLLQDLVGRGVEAGDEGLAAHHAADDGARETAPHLLVRQALHAVKLAQVELHAAGGLLQDRALHAGHSRLHTMGRVRKERRGVRRNGNGGICGGQLLAGNLVQ